MRGQARACFRRTATAASSPGSQVDQRLVELGVVALGEVPGPHRLPQRVEVEPGQVEPAGDDAVLDVVDGVGDVVGEVHHLRLEALAGALDPARAASRTPGRSSS